MLRVSLDVLPLVGARTGVGEFVWHLANALLEAGVDVSGWGVTWRGRDRLRAAVPAELRVHDARLPARPLWAAWARWRWPSIDRVFADVDVVHATNFTLPPLRQRPSVVTVHDLTVVHHPDWCDRATLVYPKLVAAAVREGSFVHTPSEAVAREVRAWLGLDADRVVAVPHGAPPTPVASPAAPARIARLAGRRYVLALGTLEPRKGIDVLIEAFAHVAEHERDLELVLAGRWGWGVDAITSALVASPVRARIRVLGYVDPIERAWLLTNAAMLAYPSRYEGFGLPPLEAMAAGVPVVASDVPAVREVVGSAAVLAPVGDAAALAGSIGRALVDADRLRALGPSRAAQFTWDRTARAMIELYERVAAT